MIQSSRKKTIKTWSTPVENQETKTIPCALCGGTVFKQSLQCEGFSYVRCAQCGLVQMNPQPATEDVRKRYQEAYGTDYLSYEIANEASFLRLQELALRDAAFEAIEAQCLKEGKNQLLDIGCATGALLEKLRNRGWNVSGIEISTPQAEYARQERNIDVHGVPLEKAGLQSASFHAVLASHLIEHLNDPMFLIREVHRILVPGGYFLITTPNISGFQSKLFGKHWRSAIFDHLYLFSKKTLHRALKNAGFIIESTVTWGGIAAGIAPKPIKTCIDKAAKRFGFGDVMLIKAKKKHES
jgi:2-polyprenyl-3-methyl-5-hydroxy-6-metoxy-1,4-benzoquinol methylase